MLNLSNSTIVKAGGKLPVKINKKKPKQRLIPEDRLTPQSVIDYYNNPNYCLNCRKKISSNGLINLQELKSQVFCSEKCSQKFIWHFDERIFENNALLHFNKALFAAREGDLTLADYHIQELTSNLWCVKDCIDSVMEEN